MKQSRRQFLKYSAFTAAGLAAIGGGHHAWQRGIRFPRLSLEPGPLPTSLLDSQRGLKTLFSGLFETPLRTSKPEATAFSVRAFTPQPSLEITSDRVQTITFIVNNISQEAELQQTPPGNRVNEQVSGIQRIITAQLRRQETVNFTWAPDQTRDFTFAAIGDSGGNHELAWCLQRAHQLNAKFLLHLGDFNYQPGDYARAIRLFNESPIPCFISIGNHDFNENGLVYQSFLRELGPLNSAFTIGKTRFVNLDTAASFLPYHAGLRGALLDNLKQQTDETLHTLAFTHRPLYDPLPDSTHDIGSAGERDWLIHELKQINCHTLLSGHIHIYDRATINGIDNIIAGQGLGHQDLITQSDHSKMAIGHVDSEGRINLNTAPLAMPWEMHCHPRTQPVKDSLESNPGHQELLKMVANSCAT